jgi:hypothetical protein
MRFSTARTWSRGDGGSRQAPAAEAAIHWMPRRKSRLRSLRKSRGCIDGVCRFHSESAQFTQSARVGCCDFANGKSEPYSATSVFSTMGMSGASSSSTPTTWSLVAVSVAGRAALALLVVRSIG